MTVYVKLLKDVAEGGVEFRADAKRDSAGQRPKIKTTFKKNPNWFAPYVMGSKVVECSESEYITIEFRKGTVISMHEAGAEKYLSRGLGAITEQPVEMLDSSQAKAINKIKAKSHVSTTQG